MLLPKQKEAMKIVKGASIYQDTSVHTSKGAVVKIRYLDNSTISLRPNTQIVLRKMQKKDVGVINLFVGKMRAYLDDDKKKVKKDEPALYIKTKSVAMAIRGTEFEIVHNQKSDRTALLTYDGAVEMVKLEKNEIKQDAEVIIDNSKKSERVLVARGEYSSATIESTKVTEPVKINPKQFVKLDRVQKLRIKDSKFKAPKKAILTEKDALKKEVRPGGFFDQETGLYVQPDTKSKFDKKEQVFEISRSFGKVDRKGSYIPPKGLKLSAKKGFVLAQNNVSKNKVKQAITLNQNLNSKVEKEIKEKEVRKVTRLKAKSRVTLRLQEISNRIKLKSQSANLPASLDASYARQVEVDIEHKNSHNISTFASAIGKRISHNDRDFGISSARIPASYLLLKAGLMYWPKKDVTFGGGLQLDEEVFAHTNSVDNPTQLDFTKITILKMFAQVRTYFYQGDRFESYSNFGISFANRRGKNGIEANRGENYWAQIRNNFFLQDDVSLGLNLDYLYNNQGISGLDQAKEEFGLGLSLGYIF